MLRFLLNVYLITHRFKSKFFYTKGEPFSYAWPVYKARCKDKANLRYWGSCSAFVLPLKYEHFLLMAREYKRCKMSFEGSFREADLWRMVVAKQRIDKSFSSIAVELFTYFSLVSKLRKDRPLLITKRLGNTPFLGGVIDIKEQGVPVFSSYSCVGILKRELLNNKLWVKD